MAILHFGATVPKARVAACAVRRVYVADENSVEIVALAHTSRRPGYWMP